MSAAGERPVETPGRRLPSILDGFLAGVPVTLDAIEAAMTADLERRTLAALDRALAGLAGPFRHGHWVPPSRAPAPPVG